MKYFLLSMTTFLTLTAAHGQTQGEMNYDAGNKFQSAEKELDDVYQKVLNEYSEDTLFIKKLQAAQGLWLQLRHADLEARYLPNGLYGSVESMCTSALIEKWTRERTKFLKLWLEGIDHQDACKGTVKEKAR